MGKDLRGKELGKGIYQQATRCIEGGMMPKTLQKILGHSLWHSIRFNKAQNPIK